MFRGFINYLALLNQRKCRTNLSLLTYASVHVAVGFEPTIAATSSHKRMPQGQCTSPNFLGFYYDR